MSSRGGRLCTDQAITIALVFIKRHSLSGMIFSGIAKLFRRQIKPVTTFAYWTGYRKGEIRSLRWSQVDLENKTIRLAPEEAKNDEARIIPLAGELPFFIGPRLQRRTDAPSACPAALGSVESNRTAPKVAADITKFR
jgi:integrase